MLYGMHLWMYIKFLILNGLEKYIERTIKNIGCFTKYTVKWVHKNDTHNVLCCFAFFEKINLGLGFMYCRIIGWLENKQWLRQALKEHKNM